MDSPADLLFQSATDLTSGPITLDTRNKGNIVLKSGMDNAIQIVGSRLDLLDAALNLTNTHVTIDQIISQSLLINGTLITTTHSDIDIVLSPKGGGKVIVGLGKTLDVRGVTLLLDNDQISGDSINGGTIDAVTITTLTTGTVKADILTGNSGTTVTLASGKTLDVSQGTLTLAPNQISGDSINGGTIDGVAITTLTGNMSLASGKTLDVSQGVLQLADGQISGDKIKGGSILVTNLTATRINVDTIGTTVKIAPGESLDVRGATLLVDQMSIDNLKLDGNAVRSTSGDLELMCPAGQRVKVGDTLAVGQLVMKGNTLNTTDHNTLLLSPHGFGSVKIAEGKTLDLRGVTLLLDDDAIRGDKVDGGFIHNITIVELVSGQIQIGSLKLAGETISSTGDLQLKPGPGRRVEVTKPLEVQDLHLQGTTIATTTGVPVTINNMTCPVATIGSLKLHGNTITDIAAGKVILQSNTELASGKTITGNEATFTSVKTSTISTSSGDLTISPTGSNVKVASGKTLDLSGATLKLDDNAISGDKIEGGTIVINRATIGATLHVNGTAEVGDGVMSGGGYRDSHAWGSQTAHEAQLALAVNNGGLGTSVFTGGPMNSSYFKGYDASDTSPGNMKGFSGAVFDGRFVYFVPNYVGSYHGRVLRYDTQSSFTSSSSWIGYDANGTSPGNMKGFHGAVFDGRFVYFVPHNDGSSYHGRVLRYDTQSSFTSSSSWAGYDASGTSPGNMKGFIGAVFDGKYVYFVPDYDGSSSSGRVLRYDTQSSFTSSSSWTGYDASGTSPGSMVGFRGAIFDGRFVCFVPYSDSSTRHGRVLRYDTQSSFTSSGGWIGYDVSGTSPGNMKGFIGAVFDGRFVYFVPRYDGAYHGKVLRYDTQSSFTSSSSWTGYDASGTSPGNMKGFEGAIFDGRFVYFVPFSDGSYHGRVLRYDTQSSFTSSSSWTGYDASGTSPGSMKGLVGAVFDGRFVYFAPFPNGKVLRYDTRAPQPRPSLAQIATSSDLFIASSGSVGIGTKSPGERLSVEGGVKASGGFRDSHAWSSETARRSQLALAVNNGGLGSSVFAGGPMSSSYFEGYDASDTAPGNMKGYLSVTFDGRFVYFVPYYDGGSRHGKVLRYDTQSSFTSSSSWTGYDAVNTSPGNMKGFWGAVFDGRFVYFVPHYADGFHGRVLRYDTQSSFTSSSSWTGYDASGTSPGTMKGYLGAVFDGRYVYFVPHDYDSWHGKVLRYDTRFSFTSSSSWTGYDASGTSPGNMKGFSGAVFDGRFVYFVPGNDGSFHGKVLRYDTMSSFTSSTSWTGYDASGTSPGNMKGFAGAVFDGRFVYFSPYTEGSYHGCVLRYDTQSAFTSSSSWIGYDASGTSPGNIKGFVGAVFDGRYVYFVPYRDGSTSYHGKVLRYDTQSDFTTPSSWFCYDASGTSPGNMKGYRGAVFDGRFVYFSPNYDGSYHARVLRYDTRAPERRPSIQQIASNHDLFISSSSNIGIGTTSPSQKLHVEGSLGVTDKVGVGTVNPSTSLDVKGTARADHVEAQTSLTVGANTTSLGNGEAVHVDGGVGAKGGFRDSHAWGSETARRSQLALGINNGGFGSSIFTGGPMNANFFEGYDASGTSPGNMKGFGAAVSDGRFVYFVPHTDGSSHHGRVLRYDTQSSFTSSISWAGYDAGGTSPGNMKGFTGAVFDGRFVFFSPYVYGGSYHGRVLRYDTQSSFTSSSSWTGYDAIDTSPGNMRGFYGAVFDGRYVIFVPYLDGSRHGRVLRYDTRSSFTTSSSWTGYDASGTSPGNMKGFGGAVFDGRFVYFVPYNDNVGYNGKVLRFDTQSSFTSSGSWTGYDASGTSPGNMKGFWGAVFDGRFVYFVPYYDGSYHGKALRYDTQSSFTSSSSWTGYDASGTSPGNMKGFYGAVFDGRFVYFVPHNDGSSVHGKVLRYDIQSIFTSSSSWAGFDASGTSPGNMKGFKGAVFDGRFVIFVPYYDGSYHGRVLRYDTRAPQPRPSIQQIASNQDLFIASDGKVGIGTTSPTEMLHVMGNIKATGTVTATTCCGSDIRLKKDVTSLSGALETIKKMRGIRYKWKSNGEPSIGFVAQELESVVPEVVVTGSDGYKAVDYGKLSAVLAVAVQEMEEEIDALKEQAEETANRLKALEERVMG